MALPNNSFLPKYSGVCPRNDLGNQWTKVLTGRLTPTLRARQGVVRRRKPISIKKVPYALTCGRVDGGPLRAPDHSGCAEGCRDAEVATPERLGPKGPGVSVYLSIFNQKHRSRHRKTAARPRRERLPRRGPRTRSALKRIHCPSRRWPTTKGLSNRGTICSLERFRVSPSPSVSCL